MSVGALAGFALVFVVVAWSTSALGALAYTAARPALVRRGPWAARRAAEVAAVAPLALGVLVVATLVAQSLIDVDHCGAHDHHAHLCLAHGAVWSERAWVLTALAVAVVTAVGRGGALAVRYLRGAHSVRALHQLSRDLGAVRLVESPRAFCFVTRRGIYASSGAWAALGETERAAVLAHEAAHLRHGDLRIRAALEIALVFAAPFAGAGLRSGWLAACERLCDARAAAEAGDPTIVASAMLSLSRLDASCAQHAFGFTPTAADIDGRIRAVLAGGPLGERAAHHIRRIALVAGAGLAVAALATAGELHHALETLLG